MKKQLMENLSSTLNFAQSTIDATNKALYLPGLPELPTNVTARATLCREKLYIDLGCNEQVAYLTSRDLINEWLNNFPYRVLDDTTSCYAVWNHENVNISLHWWKGQNAEHQS